MFVCLFLDNFRYNFADLLYFSAIYNFSCRNNTEQYVVVKSEKHDESSNYTNLFEELGRVKNKKQMEDFLKNRINWNVRLYNCETIDCLFGNATAFTSNRSHAEQEKANYLLLSMFCDECAPKNESSFTTNSYYNNDKNLYQYVELLKTYHVVFAILGAVAVFGNGVAIYHKVLALIKHQNARTNENKIYNVLVLNLCLADMLMAIYLIVHPLALVYLEKVSSNLCNFWGVSSALSMQASVSFLVIIAAYHLYGVQYPYGIVRIKTVVILIMLVWFVWLVVVSLPLFNESLFHHAFTRVVEKKRNRFPIYRIYQSLGKIIDHAVNVTDEPFFQIVKALKKYRSRGIAFQLLKSFDLLDFENNRVLLHEYYCPNRGCTIEIFLLNKDATSYFSLFLLSFDLASYVVIAFAYAVILKNIASSSITNFLPCAKQRNFVKQPARIINKRKTENNQIYIRIFVVVFTDLICIAPICVIGYIMFFQNFGDECSLSQHRLQKSWTPLVASILLPLNCIVNPYIYSFSSCKKVLQRLKNLLFTVFSNS